MYSCPRRFVAALILISVCVMACDGADRAPADPSAAEASAPAWTCGMHPDVVEDQHGRCPVCNMELTRRDAHEALGAATVVIDPVVVQNMGLRLGEVIKGRLSQTLRLLATVHPGDPDKWLELTLFDRHRPFIRPGQQVRARFPGAPGKTYRSEISFVGTEVDPMTRTISARANLEGDVDLLLPGMYATAEVLALNAEESLLVPREAIIDSGRRQIVFLALGGGRFEPRTVELGTLSEDWAQVRAGLSRGDQIVISGQFLLDSESRLQEGLEKHRAGTWEIPIFKKDSAH